ncbi:uncharacterized protein DUF262 [Grimontella sp. AG753]|nr:uncharacterized protein DUF262 [Grimontella sp. AG753]
MKIETNSITPRVSDLYKQIRDGSLILKPPFQRNFVWTMKHQEEFIDTILKGFPFPEVYVCDGEIDTVTFNSTTLVIDGQQRLTTIKRYIEGEGTHEFKNTPKYNDLTTEEKESFLGYKVVVRNIGNVEENIIREVFRRINLTKFSLDAIEIQNAIYDGEFIQTAKNILDSIDIKDYGVLKTSELDRMADLHYILLIMATIENGGYFSQDAELEGIIEKFNEEYPGKDYMTQVLISSFELVDKCNLPQDSVWFRKSNFFSLLVELSIFLMQRNEKSCTTDPSRVLPAVDALAVLLNQFSKDLYRLKDSESPYKEYYPCMYQGTNNRKSRVIRSDTIRDMILSKL